MSNVFADGISVYKPNENAPDFVKASLVINFKDLFKFCEANQNYLTGDNDTLRLQIKESKQGKLYASVDTYQKQETQPNTLGMSDDDLPF